LSVSAGASLLHYRLAEKIGQGGMGEVWRGTDTTLSRDVAIKFLPASLASDPDRLARFEREAKVLASLNHPNIAGIYGLHDADGVRFLAMELVAGEDLAERLKQGTVPFSEAMEIAAQIAEALEAAHDQGIVHRDLKPANIRLTPEGRVKVLDFGLAKAIESATSSGSRGDAAMSPTITSLGTVAGVILGTAAYMSPEQARGKGVDKRADIWAFGCVLYEMLTGLRPFDGETISDTLAAVLARDADWSALPASTPAKVREVIQRCLEKDPKRRMRDIGDARLELQEALADRTASGRVRVLPAAEAGAAAPRSVPRWAQVAVVLGAVLGGIVLGWFVASRSPVAAGRRAVRLDLDFPSDVRVTDYHISPDGSAVAAIGVPRVPPGQTPPPPRIYVRKLDSGTMMAVPGTEGVPGSFGFSANGRSILAGIPATLGSQQLNLMRVRVDGGAPPFTVTSWNPRWTAGSVLHNDDLVVLEDGTSLVRIPGSGGGPGPAVKVDLAGEPGPITLAALALPGDDAILLHTIAYGAKGWYYRLGVLDLKAARVTYLLDDGGFPVYSPATGQIVFSRGDTLLAVGFDPKTLKLTGTPVPLASGVRTEFGFQPARFELSDDGVLVFAPGGRTAEGRRLGFVDAAGTVTAVTDERHAYQSAHANSADGRRFVTTITNGQGIDELWTGELDRPGLRRIHAIADADLFTPLLTRDGRTVVFGRRGHHPEDGVYAIDLDTGAPARRIASSPIDDIQTQLTSFAPDGSGVIAERVGADQKRDIYFLPVPAAGGALSELKPIVTGSGNDLEGTLSPDGRWLAYASDESGRFEVYVAAFRGGSPVGERLRVTRAGGRRPFWSADGRAIRYDDLGGRIMSLPLTATAPPSPGSPSLVFDAQNLNVYVNEILPDGRQFVVLRGDEESDELHRLSVVLGFTGELAEKTKGAR
jgi:serine/threonine-protein kinase